MGEAPKFAGALYTAGTRSCRGLKVSAVMIATMKGDPEWRMTLSYFDTDD